MLKISLIAPPVASPVVQTTAVFFVRANVLLLLIVGTLSHVFERQHGRILVFTCAATPTPIDGDPAWMIYKTSTSRLHRPSWIVLSKYRSCLWQIPTLGSLNGQNPTVSRVGYSSYSGRFRLEWVEHGSHLWKAWRVGKQSWPLHCVALWILWVL